LDLTGIALAVEANGRTHDAVIEVARLVVDDALAVAGGALATEHARSLIPRRIVERAPRRLGDRLLGRRDGLAPPRPEGREVLHQEQVAVERRRGEQPVHGAERVP